MLIYNDKIFCNGFLKDQNLFMHLVSLKNEKHRVIKEAASLNIEILHFSTRKDKI